MYDRRLNFFTKRFSAGLKDFPEGRGASRTFYVAGSKSRPLTMVIAGAGRQWSGPGLVFFLFFFPHKLCNYAPRDQAPEKMVGSENLWAGWAGTQPPRRFRLRRPRRPSAPRVAPRSHHDGCRSPAPMRTHLAPSCPAPRSRQSRLPTYDGLPGMPRWNGRRPALSPRDTVGVTLPCRISCPSPCACPKSCCAWCTATGPRAPGVPAPAQAFSFYLTSLWRWVEWHNLRPMLLILPCFDELPSKTTLGRSIPFSGADPAGPVSPLGRTGGKNASQRVAIFPWRAYCGGLFEIRDP